MKKRIKGRLEFFAFRKRQKNKGKPDIAQLIANRGLNKLDKAINIGWEVENAPVVLKRTQQSRSESPKEAEAK